MESENQINEKNTKCGKFKFKVNPFTLEENS